MKIKNVEMIVNFGALGYDAKKISSILGVPEAEIIQELKDKNSELSKLFQKGVDMSDYVIDLKIFEMAKSGDIKAIDMFEKRKKTRTKAKRYYQIPEQD